MEVEVRSILRCSVCMTLSVVLSNSCWCCSIQLTSTTRVCHEKNYRNCKNILDAC